MTTALRIILILEDYVSNCRIVESSTGELVFRLPVKRVKFSPDYSQIATVNSDFDVQISSLDFEIHTLGDFQHRLVAVRLNRDERFVAALDVTGRIRVWDCKTEKLVHELQAGKVARYFAISPSGQYIGYAKTNGEIEVAQLGSSPSKPRSITRVEAFGAMVFVDETTLAVSDANVVSVVSLTSNSTRILDGHTSSIIAAKIVGHELITESIRRRLTWSTDDWSSTSAQGTFESISPFDGGTSPTEDWFIYPSKGAVELVDLSFAKSKRETTRRKHRVRPDSEWHLRKAREAHENRRYVEATFHYAWAYKTGNQSQRTSDSFSRCYSKLDDKQKSALRISTPVVHQTLEKIGWNIFKPRP